MMSALLKKIFTLILATFLFTWCYAQETLELYKLETVTLPCDAYTQISLQPEIENITVRWEGPAGSKDIVNSNTLLTNGRYKLSPSLNYSLVISEADPGLDSGIYRCIADGLFVIDVNQTYQALATTQATLLVTDILPDMDESSSTSEILLKVKDPKPPGTPEASIKSPDSISLKWTKSDGPVVNYIVNYRIYEAPSWSQEILFVNESQANSTYVHFTVTQLLPFTPYVFLINATFELGYSKVSPVSEIIYTASGSPLLAPTNVTAVVLGPFSATVTWVPPPESSFQGLFRWFWVKYERVETDDDSKGVADRGMKNTNETQIILGNLRPFSNYSIRVAVENDAERALSLGPTSQVVNITTFESVPSQITSIVLISSNKNSIFFFWFPPEPANGVILRYNAYLKKKTGDSGDWKLFTTDKNFFRFSNLEIYTVYTVKVAAVTSIGEGSNSSAMDASTEVGPASPPVNITVTMVSPTSAEVKWGKPLTFYKSIDSYIIQYWPNTEYHSSIMETVDMGMTRILKDLEVGMTYQLVIKATTKGIQTSNHFVEGVASEPLEFVAIYIVPTSQIPEKSVTEAAVNRRSGGLVIVLLLLIIAATCTGVLLAIIWNRMRKRNHMSLEKHNGMPPAFTFTKPDELKEPPIYISRFENHVIANHANSDGGFATEYEDIQAVGTNFEAYAGMEECNKLKNRYTNIVAYDHTRVILQTLPGQPESHYINANYIDGYNRQGAYIATQGPLKNTIDDFWRMVWEQKVFVIVMITKLEERGRRKCERYWPPLGMSERFRDIEVSLEKKEKFSSYCLRTLLLRFKPKRHGKAYERTLLQFHYTDWPDHGVPPHTLPVLDFVQRSSSSNPQDGGPILVHCSAGVGRTGTYIVIDTMLQQMKAVGKVNVFGFLKKIREQRNYLVQTEEQYVFIHDVLLEWLKCGNTRIKGLDLKQYVDRISLPNEAGILELDSQHELIINQKIQNHQLMKARNSVNKQKNRQSTVIPVERGRVTITGRPGVDCSDYINASFLQGYRNNRAFIVTQYPLEHTMADYWKMLWETNTATIVMLSDKDEEGQPVYWPSSKEKSLTFNHLKVTLCEEELSNMSFIIRDFLVESSEDDDQIQIRQYCCSYWPECCTPIHTTFDLIYAVEKRNKQLEQVHKDMMGPVTVHDKCGGRQAGTFCALLSLHEELMSEGSVDVYKLTKLYSSVRIGMFKARDDYHFLYKALASVYVIEQQLLTFERHKLAGARKERKKVHRDWSFLVRHPNTTVDNRLSDSHKRNSLDEDELFRSRSHTLGSTGRVPRPSKLWHRRARSEKRKPIQNGLPVDVRNKTGSSDQEVPEVYELESVESDDYMKPLDDVETEECEIESGSTIPDTTTTPEIHITAYDLPSLEELSAMSERRLLRRSADKLDHYNGLNKMMGGAGMNGGEELKKGQGLNEGDDLFGGNGSAELNGGTKDADSSLIGDIGVDMPLMGDFESDVINGKNLFDNSNLNQEEVL